MADVLENTNQTVKSEASTSSNYIREIMLEDIKNQKNGGAIQTRFPTRTQWLSTPWSPDGAGR